MLDTVRINAQMLRQKGSFAQNFAITFSGTAIITALGFLLTPIMARIYSPAAYGLFAVFNTFVNNINLASTLAYPPAFLLPKLHKRFLAMVQLTLLLTGGAFVLTSIVIIVLHDRLLHWFNAEQMGGWLYVIPVTVFIFNLNMIMNSWYLRSKDFKKRAGVDVSTTLAGRAITIGSGLLTHGAPGGLIVGDIFGRLAGLVAMLFGGIHHRLAELTSVFNWRRIKSVAYEYRQFPMYLLPTSYINVLAAQLPIFFLTKGFGTGMVGLYAFSTSLLELPINVLGSAISPVFTQKALETHHTHPEKLADLCVSMFNKLFYLGLLPFGIITIFGDWIFKFAFGARWEMAGVFTGYLGYYYMFKIASYATSPVYGVFHRQHFALIGTIMLLLVRAASLYIGIHTHNLNLGMFLFGITSLVVTFGTDMHILHILHIKVWRVALRCVTLVSATLGVLWAIRMGLQALFMS